MYDVTGKPMSCHPMFGGILAVCRARVIPEFGRGGSDRRCVLVHRATFLF
jgi:hypothetical protein